MSEGKPKPPSELAEYAKSLLPEGCKHGLEPVPHDHLVAYQDARYSPAQRVWACLCLHQFPRGHRNPRKPWATCCNQCRGGTGTPMQPKHIARHLKIDEGNVRRALEYLESEKRIVWGREKEIAVTGDFTLPAIHPPPLDDLGDPKCTDLWPRYLANRISKLEKSTVARVISEKLAMMMASDAFQADLVAANRRIWDEKDDTMLAGVGVKAMREVHTPKDAARRAEVEARNKRIEVFLPTLRNFIQTFEAEVCTLPQNGSVQTEAPPPNPMFTGVPDPPTEVLKKKGRSPGSGGGEKPVSSSSSGATTTTTTPKRILFEQQAVAVFTTAGKGAPTPKQVAEAWTFFPAEASLNQWTDFLTETEPSNKKPRVARLQHAGAIVAVTQEFARSWKQGEKDRAEGRERRKRADEHQRLELIELARRTLNDPAADEKDKEDARSVMASYGGQTT
jgi:hypothetical protein